MPLHNGTDDVQVFNEAKEAVDKHFDIRRVFGISETSEKPAKEAEPIEKAKPTEEPQLPQNAAEGEVI